VRARLTGALSKGGKMRGVATNVYLWKTLEKPKETGQNKNLSSGVVFTLEEGISTSYVCLERQQPIF